MGATVQYKVLITWYRTAAVTNTNTTSVFYFIVFWEECVITADTIHEGYARSAFRVSRTSYDSNILWTVARFCRDFESFLVSVARCHTIM